MMLHIPEVLTKAEVRDLRARLDAAPWVDGRMSAGPQGATVKRNKQLPIDHPVTLELGNIVLQALARNPLYFSAALPLRVAPPMFNSYDQAGEEHYGFHVDGAVRAVKNAPHGWVRTDLSATLFLCEPEDYEGGELTVRDTYGEHAAKLPAGDMVLYPSSSVHCVTPVTRGTRVCSFMWLQSMVRHDHQRTMLYDLDQTINSLRARLGETEETVSLAATYHNLLREWSEI
ncbi:Fe2+-dependent dioxygenase [Amantichitinum ursilacus]|uniref:PKHD-type hydroxylase n=1 Tax=Amantichitinum ursilacus TaxID=857265 RepID=A0A0N0XK37_9NEIS|nr:Fe2+-dependent dioxygenase [Amantichitinum ursilacus]KPC54200.1 PKHD-type hydroxylase [Amantichitinum ursilacus]